MRFGTICRCAATASDLHAVGSGFNSLSDSFL